MKATDHLWLMFSTIDDLDIKINRSEKGSWRFNEESSQTFTAK